MSQAPEDRATTKRCRVLPQIVISRRGRLVSRFGKNHVKSTTWTPSTPGRVVWSRPNCRPRSARTSSPRRARARRWKGAGLVYEVSPMQSAPARRDAPSRVCDSRTLPLASMHAAARLHWPPRCVSSAARAAAGAARVRHMCSASRVAIPRASQFHKHVQFHEQALSASPRTPAPAQPKP